MNNYIVIMNFMIDELGLKGNELIIYALIYGFSQDGASDFHGSLDYIQQRTGLSRPSVVDILKKLVKKDLVVKSTEFRNNTKMCHYEVVKKLNYPQLRNLTGGSKETLLNNKIENKEYIYNVELEEKISEILKYLNFKTNKNFRLETKNYRDCIRARLNEGYSISDLKKVIDIKTKDWLNTEMNKYLNPNTLFRPSNFQNYLNDNSGTNSSSDDEVIITTDWGCEL